MNVSDQTLVDAAGVCVSLGGMPVLRDVSLRLGQGRMLALLGSNGSGKTTFLRALLGLVPTTRGRINWFGTPLNRFKDWQRIGYVPQRNSLQGAQSTVKELVSSGLLAERHPFQPIGAGGQRAVASSLAEVELSDRASWPLGKLSGGQLQRALIARGLVGGPEILILDEPMAGIDLHTQDRLGQLFARLKESGLALLVVLHEQGSLADLIDETVILREGRVHDRQVSA